MREILFRAKTKATKEWTYGYFAKQYDVPQIYADNGHECVYEDTLCQYTGFMDSEQNKIFEGDIVETSRFYNNVSQTTYNYLCRYDSGLAAFVCNYIIPEDVSSVHRKYVNLSRHADLGDFMGHPLKVIGNIYDNPELLSAESRCI